MAKLYGSLRSNTRKTISTKTGSSWIAASVQSWNGSIITDLDAEGNFEIAIAQGSQSYGGKTIMKGNITEELNKHGEF